MQLHVALQYLLRPLVLQHLRLRHLQAQPRRQRALQPQPVKQPLLLLSSYEQY